LANPDRWSPVLSGYDAVKYVEEGKLVDGRREFGTVIDGQMYLFADLAAQERFEGRPDKFMPTVRQAMNPAGASGAQGMRR
jgi:hypothetical protein